MLIWRTLQFCRCARPSIIQKIQLGASRTTGWHARWTKAVDLHEPQDGGDDQATCGVSLLAE
jgi:hypothetical protein